MRAWWQCTVRFIECWVCVQRIVSKCWHNSPFVIKNLMSESRISFTAIWIQWRCRMLGATVSWRSLVEKRNFKVISLKSEPFGFTCVSTTRRCTRYSHIASVRSCCGQCPTIVRGKLIIVCHYRYVPLQCLHRNYVEMLALLKDLYSRKLWARKWRWLLLYWQSNNMAYVRYSWLPLLWWLLYCSKQIRCTYYLLHMVRLYVSLQHANWHAHSTQKLVHGNYITTPQETSPWQSKPRHQRSPQGSPPVWQNWSQTSGRDRTGPAATSRHTSTVFNSVVTYVFASVPLLTQHARSGYGSP